MAIKPNSDIELRFINLASKEDSIFWIAKIGLGEDGSGFTFDLWTTLADSSGRRGSYHRCIPISSLDYRVEHCDSRAMIERLSLNGLRIVDDWGRSTIIETSPEIVSALVEEARKWQLLAQKWQLFKEGAVKTPQ